MLEGKILVKEVKKFIEEEVDVGSLLFYYVGDWFQGLSMKFQLLVCYVNMEVMNIDKNIMWLFEIKEIVWDGMFKGSLLYVIR